MSGYRVATGGNIDRSKPIAFRWGGRELSGFEGDTLASALLANGIDIVGRSFKYHRPRGLLAAGLEEPNAIVQIGQGGDAIANLKATEVTLTKGLQAGPVNAWPSVQFDLMSLNSWFKPFIPAAFYYKTFMWPNWHWFEPAIRRAAGLGKVPMQADPDMYSQRFEHVDTLIVGGGIAGLREAISAGRAGNKTLLVEHESVWGGRVSPDDVEGVAGKVWIDRAVSELRQMRNVRLLTEATGIGYYDHDLIAISERLPVSKDGGSVRERLWKVRAARTVLAMGAIERPLVFKNNDRPGIMLASAALTYLDRFGVMPGREIVIATTNDSAYFAAAALHRAGATIKAILDSRSEKYVSSSVLAALDGVPIEFESAPFAATGRKRIRGVIPGRLDQTSAMAERLAPIECDTLLMSGGWSPVVHLHSQAGGKLLFDEARATFLPVGTSQNAECVGAASGDHLYQGNVRPVWTMNGPNTEPSSSAWVDFQNDVTAADIAIAARENFHSVEHLKRYTTLGMATDQGKTSNINGLAVMGSLLLREPGQVGTTTFRPPYNPTTIGVFAGVRTGAEIHPEQRLCAHDAHLVLGAQMDDYGRWRRPAFYSRVGESEADAVAREALAVRNGVGLFDASSLGKIEVLGRDAGEFLDRIYVGTMSTLKVGRCRYGLMLNEHGTVFDDGVVARMADDHFLVGATSGHASLVSRHLEEWLQCEWMDLQVATLDVTTSWSTLNLAGPLSRDVLTALDSDIDFSADALPHLGWVRGKLLGVDCRIQRVSFSGELSYEISVPWFFGASLHRQLVAAGTRYGITPFGIEALMTLRIEKGFLHVGSETDGTTLPQDFGYERMIARKATDFVGKRSTMRPDGRREDRRQFVGVDALDGSVLPIGGHIVEAGAKGPGRTQGWITSSAYSPSLETGVALAMVSGGRERLGSVIDVWHLGKSIRAKLVEPCRIDPKGVRMNG